MLIKVGIDYQCLEVQDYFKDKLKNPFAHIDNLYKLEQHLLTNRHYIKPEKVTLGKRWDSTRKILLRLACKDLF